MAVSVKENSFVAAGGQSIALNAMFTVTASTSNPTYLVLNGLDRNEYTVAATGATGTLNGNGATDSFSSIGDDGRGVSAVFTYQSSTGRYYSSTYGYFDQMTYQVSASNSDVTSLSLFATNSLTLANNSGKDAYAMMQADAAGYLGSATIVTQPSFSGPVPSQATPSSIAAIAMTFVGKAWNLNGCWTLASTIATEAGASLPIDSTMVGMSGQANGEWFVAFDGTKQSGNWQSLVKAGEIIVIGDSSSGHITTCVSGSGSSAMLVDNVTYTNSQGTITNLANDGSSNDVTVATPHLASQEWVGVSTSLVKIYELDAPIVTALLSKDLVTVNARQLLSQDFSAADPAGKSITQYQVYDTATADSFLVTGSSSLQTAHSASAAITVTSLSSISLAAGATAGTDSIEVRAFNGVYWGDWQALAVTVTSSALPPTVTLQTANQTWTQGQHVTLTLPANTFTDPNGLTLTYAATQANGQALPSWLSFNGTTDSFSAVVPSASQSLSLKVTATDSAGLSASESFTVTVPAVTTTPTPSPSPSHGASGITLTQTPDQTWTAGKAVAFALPANTFTDSTGHILITTAYQVSGSSITSWLRYNPGTETFSGTAPKTVSGTVTLEVMALDSNFSTATDIFHVTFTGGTVSSSLVGVSSLAINQGVTALLYG